MEIKLVFTTQFQEAFDILGFKRKKKYNEISWAVKYLIHLKAVYELINRLMPGIVLLKATATVKHNRRIRRRSDDAGLIQPQSEKT